MRKYRVGVCDDERGTCAEIETAVRGFFTEGHYDVEVEVWYSGESCIKTLEREPFFDIIFLDIELPGINGVDVGKYIRESLKNDNLQIVYISSKTGYALDLFQVHPYDFLIKPITYQSVSNILLKILNLDENDSKTFRYKNGRNDETIPLGKIMFLESDNKHIKIHLANGTTREYIGKLSVEKEKLPKQFITVAKSFIVNMKYIASCNKTSLVLTDEKIINITSPHRDEFRLAFTQFLEGGVL